MNGIDKKIAIIGGGNLGQSIVDGLLKSGKILSKNITVTRRKSHLIARYKKDKIQVHSDNKKAVNESEIIFICVKPSETEAILNEIKSELNPQKHIIISTITGISIEKIKKIIVSETPVFRAMPNTAISIQESMTLIATNNSTEKQKQIVIKLFKELGEAIIINEELMGSATVLGACGIAFALRFIRATMQGGIEIGFDSNLAKIIASQTVKGASKLVLESGHHPEREIDKVTTPRGITIAGLNEMEHNGFSSALIKGLLNSYNKINEIDNK
ncbi:MAG: pyrroline-5-carboxylate reductase [Candidatus Marinimicrobia bacterium]|nr:pyrroline-5-carboxylate reductase [Candidatus Neomarinimicrobiota bacterium]